MRNEWINLPMGNDSELEGMLSNEGVSAKREEPIKKRSKLGKIADMYFRPKFFEKSGRIYKWMGIKYFQKAVMGTVGKSMRKSGGGWTADNYFIGKKRDTDSLKYFESKTRFNETVHAPVALYGTILCAINLPDAMAKNDYSGFIIGGALLFLNGYITMLQRYNRARVYEAIEHRGRKNK